MDRGIEQPLPPALRGLPIARVFLDVWNEPRVEDRFAVVPGIEPAIEIEIRTVDLQIRQSGHALQGVQSVRKEHATGCGFLKAVEFGCKPPWSWVLCRRQRIG